MTPNPLAVIPPVQPVSRRERLGSGPEPRFLLTLCPLGSLWMARQARKSQAHCQGVCQQITNFVRNKRSSLPRLQEELSQGARVKKAQGKSRPWHPPNLVKRDDPARFFHHLLWRLLPSLPFPPLLTP